MLLWPDHYRFTLVGISVPRSRSMVRRCGGGVSGGVIVAMGGMGIILMLSSASAPSRVPQVVWPVSASPWQRRCGARKTNLCDGNAPIQLDEIVKVPKQDGRGNESHVTRVS